MHESFKDTNIPIASKTGSKPLLSLKWGTQTDERPPEGHSWLLVRLLSAPHHAREPVFVGHYNLQLLLLSWGSEFRCQFVSVGVKKL